MKRVRRVHFASKDAAAGAACERVQRHERNVRTMSFPPVRHHAPLAAVALIAALAVSGCASARRTQQEPPRDPPVQELCYRERPTLTRRIVCLAGLLASQQPLPLRECLRAKYLAGPPPGVTCIDHRP